MGIWEGIWWLLLMSLNTVPHSTTLTACSVNHPDSGHLWLPITAQYPHLSTLPRYGALNLETGRSTLFMPRLPESYAVWMGPLKRCGAGSGSVGRGADGSSFRTGGEGVTHVGRLRPLVCSLQSMSAPSPPLRLYSPQHYAAMYGVDEVKYVDEMAASLQGGGGVLHLLKGTNTDSGMEVWGWLNDPAHMHSPHSHAHMIHTCTSTCAGASGNI